MAKGRFRRGARRAASVASAARKRLRSFRSGRRTRRASGRGGFNSVLAGGAANVGARVGAKYLGPQWGPAAGMATAAYLMNDDTGMWMAGFVLGNQVPLGNFGNAPGGIVIGA